MSQNKIKYSIIIPTYNEDKIIERLLVDLEQQIRDSKLNVETIIVDGASEDRTIEKCTNFDVRVIHTEKGRGKQLSIGAENARGERLIFIHADSKLTENTISFIDKNFNKNRKIATFRMKFDCDSLLYKYCSFFTRFDSIFSTFGDQGVIVEKNFYNKVGGFKNLLLMEDIDFFRRARKFTKIKKFNKYIISSSRKFERDGIVKTQIKNFILIIRYLLGTNTEILYNNYYHLNYEQEKSDNHFRKISGIRKSQNEVSLNNK